MSNFVAALDAEIASLQRELEADPRFVKLQELRRVRLIYEGTSIVPVSQSPRAATTSRPPRSGVSVMIVDNVKEFLADKEAATPTRDIMEFLVSAGVNVGGTNPQGTVSSILSKSPEFVSHGRSGWTLAQKETPDDATPAGSASSGAHVGDAHGSDDEGAVSDGASHSSVLS